MIVLDFKSGRVESDATNQLKGYAYGCLPKFPNVKKIIIVTAWLRTQIIDVVTYSHDEIARDFYFELVGAFDSDKYGPGPSSCVYCPRLECEAKSSMNRGAIAQLVEISGKKNSPVQAIQYAKAYDKILFINKAAEDAKTVIKDHIKEYGPIKLPEGGSLGLEQRERQNILIEPALPVLAAHLLPEPLPTIQELVDVLMPALSISKTKLLEIVSDNAERGQKGAACAALLAHLEEYSAIDVSVSDVITVFKEAE